MSRLGTLVLWLVVTMSASRGDFEEAERVLALLGRSGVFGNDPTEPLAVRIVPGKSREALEAAPFFVVAVV